MSTTEPGYTRAFFDPPRVHRRRPRGEAEVGAQRESVYVFSDEIILAVNVAMATGRPLLVRGESGSGKSSLARSVAEVLGWRFYESVITSRTEARDLQWDVDLVRRLHDARSADTKLGEELGHYVMPGLLWWAFDRSSASEHGRPDPQSAAPVNHPCAVVLLDEIDKADPDVPNNLLEPLGSLRFSVEETGVTVAARKDEAPLVFLTTNEERELPPAFLRRCVEITLERPRRERILEIARAHFQDAVELDELTRIADALLGPAASEGQDEAESPVGAAEFLDTVRAKAELGVRLDSEAWRSLTAITAWKHGREAAKI